MGLKPPRLEGSALERARAALDQLLLPEATELLRESRVQSAGAPEVLKLFASLHALRGEEQVAKGGAGRMAVVWRLARHRPKGAKAGAEGGL